MSTFVFLLLFWLVFRVPRNTFNYSFFLHTNIEQGKGPSKSKQVDSRNQQPRDAKFVQRVLAAVRPEQLSAYCGNIWSVFAREFDFFSLL